MHTWPKCKTVSQHGKSWFSPWLGWAGEGRGRGLCSKNLHWSPPWAFFPRCRQDVCGTQAYTWGVPPLLCAWGGNTSSTPVTHGSGSGAKGWGESSKPQGKPPRHFHLPTMLGAWGCGTGRKRESRTHRAIHLHTSVTASLHHLWRSRCQALMQSRPERTTVSYIRTVRRGGHQPRGLTEHWNVTRATEPKFLF